MDTTISYVEMCKKAHEIQCHDFERGDYFYIPKGTRYTGEPDGIADEDIISIFIPQEGRYYPFTSVYTDVDSTVMCIGTVFSEYPFAEEYCISDVVWLPRQDQLQGMLSDDGVCLVLTLGKFFVERLLSNASLSMEQLWLAIVMHVQFNKTWNSIEWIKEK